MVTRQVNRKKKTTSCDGYGYGYGDGDGDSDGGDQLERKEHTQYRTYDDTGKAGQLYHNTC